MGPSTHPLAPSVPFCAKLKMTLNYVMCVPTSVLCGSFHQDLVSQFGRVAAYMLGIRGTHLGFNYRRDTGKSRLVAGGWNFKALIIKVSRNSRRRWSIQWLKARGIQSTRSGRERVPVRWCTLSKFFISISMKML